MAKIEDDKKKSELFRAASSNSYETFSVLHKYKSEFGLEEKFDEHFKEKEMSARVFDNIPKKFFVPGFLFMTAQMLTDPANLVPLSLQIVHLKSILNDLLNKKLSK